MELLQTKSLLAKLMATENLIVEQKSVETASFDVKNRVLVLPMFDRNISGYLYDLLVGHEVGHALYTPEEGIYKARDLGINLSLMNVLEDSRIERKIKHKYPGIRASFIRGYTELISKDFFGTAGANLNNLNFIDKVNLFCKGGPTQGIIFNEFEKDLVNQIESTTTYDDVIEVAKKVVDYLKLEEEERQKIKQSLPQEPDEAEDDEDFDNSGYEDSDEDTDAGEKKPQEPQSIPSDEQEETKEQKDSDGVKTEEPDIEGSKKPNEESGIKSHTDEAYRENQKKLYLNDADEYYYGNIPDVNLDEVIVTHKQLWNNHKKFYAEAYAYDNERGIDEAGFRKLRQDSSKVVSYLAKEFEMRKNADQMKRASIAKTGELNMSKIYSYMFSEDVFKKATIVPAGKSHGLVMFIDWSGSMDEHLGGTVKQLINLCLFCKKVSIPFEVYAFSTEYGNADDMTMLHMKEGDIVYDKIKLLNFLSSKMTASEFTYAGAALLKMSNRYHRPHDFSLGGTPLNEAIIAAMKLIPEFKKQYKLQIVNTVFLTDGEGHTTNRVWQDFTGTGELYQTKGGATSTRHSRDIFVIRDPKTKHQEMVSGGWGVEVTNAYLKLLKARTDCNIVGFYVLTNRDFRNACYRYAPKSVNHDLLRAEFRKNKYAVFTNAGYDEYYMLKSDALDTDEDVEFEVKSQTTRGLVSAFSKYTGNRLNNRVVLNRFIGMIT
jgi:hypothetical protein